MDYAAEPSFKNAAWKEKKAENKGGRQGRHKNKDKDDGELGRKSDRHEKYAPPRVIPRKKYCDITGFATNYKDKESGMFFADKTVHQYLKTVPKTVKDQYLSLRGVERTNPLFQV